LRKVSAARRYSSILLAQYGFNPGGLDVSARFSSVDFIAWSSSALNAKHQTLNAGDADFGGPSAVGFRHLAAAPNFYAVTYSHELDALFSR
jgi:hypothetical protein